MDREIYIRRMVDNIKYAAEEHGLELWECVVEDIHEWDDIFNDGGRVRCELFVDIADEYAIEYAKFDSEEFYEIRNELIKEALNRLKDIA